MSKIEFVIPTYSRTELLFTIVCSILAQTNQNWTIHIVGDNIPQNNLDRLNSFLNVINDDRIKFTNLPDRYNDWGHTPRNYGVEHATSEWVIMTGEDNYYCPEFVEEMLQQSNGQHFVYCDMVHNWMNKEYIPIKSKLELGFIDIGCFMVKTNMAKKIKLNVKEEWADWYFVLDFVKKYEHAKINKVNKILYVHN
jgi:glycosyltransferase involved in cell wall biosynthesis